MSMSFSLARNPDGTDSTSKVMAAGINAATQAGIHVAVAAGNDGKDACDFAPSFTGGANGNAVTVGSVSITNTVSSFSNTGPCVDVYAPGERIISTWMGGNNVINVEDGTSMATPHVAGLMAYLMVQNSTLASDPAAMKQYLRDTALQGQISGPKAITGDPLLLANNGAMIK
jgi:cerevisin